MGTEERQSALGSHASVGDDSDSDGEVNSFWPNHKLGINQTRRMGAGYETVLAPDILRMEYDQLGRTIGKELM